MATRERPRDRGRRLARSDLIRIGGEIRLARQTLGRSIHDAAATAGLSVSQASRIERAALGSTSIDQLARLGAAVGLDVRVRAYPGPDPVRDSAQIALLDRLRVRIHADLTFSVEVPIGVERDQRAWDAVIGRLIDPEGVHRDLPVEAETRIVDVQAQLRRITLKLLDAGHQHLLLLVSDTRRNRDAIRFAAPLLEGRFPVSARTTLAALADGRHPGGGSIVFL